MASGSQTQKVRIVYEIEEANARRAQDRLQKGNQGLESSFSKTQSSILTMDSALNLAGRAAGLAASAFSKTFDALDQGQRIDGVARGFKDLQSQAGLLTDVSLAKLRTATIGMTSDFELMQKANTAVQLGLDPAKFDSLAAAATKLGVSVGRSASESIDDLTIALGRNSPKILDNLGIILKADNAYGELAQSLGKTTAQLTFQDKAIFEINKKAAALGEIQINAGIAANQMSVSMTNAFDEFSTGIIKSETLGEALSTMSGRLERIDFEQLGKDIGDIAAKFVKTADEVLKLAVSLGILEEEQKKLLNIRDKSGKLAEAEIEHNERFNKTAQGRLANIKEELRTLPISTSNVAQRLKLLGEAREIQEKLNKRGEESNENTKKSIRLQSVFIPGLSDQSKRQEEVTERTQETIDAVKELRKKYQELQTSAKLNDLKEALEAAADAGNQVEFDALREKLAEAIKEGHLSGLKEGVNKSDSELQDYAKKIGDQTSKELAAAIESERVEEAYKSGVDFWQDAFSNAVNGEMFNLEDSLKRIGVGFAAQMANAFVPGAGQFNDLQGLGSSLAQSILGQGGGLSSIFGGAGGAPGVPQVISVGGQAPVAAGGAQAAGMSSMAAGGLPAMGAALAVASAIDIGSDAFSGERVNDLQSFLTFGTGGFLINPLVDAFGSGKSEEAQIRDQIRDFLRESLGDDLTFQGVGGELNIFRDELNQLGVQDSATQGTDAAIASNALGLVSGLGTILSGGEDVDFENVLANVVSGLDAGDAAAQNFNEQLVNTQALMSSIGMTADQGKNQLTQMFLEGEVGLAEFGKGVESFNLLARDNLVGEGSVSDAIGIIARSLGEEGSPRVALKGLEFAFKEMAELGIEQADEIRAYLTDRFGPDAANAIANMAESGIDSFTDFSSLSGDQVFQIFDSLTAVQDQLITAQEQIGGLSEDLQIPDQEVNVTVNVRYREENNPPPAAEDLENQIRAAVKRANGVNLNRSLGIQP